MNEINKAEEKHSQAFFLIVAITILFRIMLQVQLPLYILADAVEDDQLMVHYALNIEAGEWLGNYSGATLEKMPGFPLYLAIMDALNIPFSFGLGVVYSLAALCFLLMIRKYVKSYLLQYVLFCVVLFSPIMYSDMAQRVYNLSICPTLTVLLISSFFSLFKECERGIKYCAPWAVLAVFSTSYAYIVRPDNISFVLFAFGAAVVIAVKTVRSQIEKKEKIIIGIVSFLPVLFSVLTINIICMVNYLHYGLYVASDFTDTAFSDVCEDLMLIDAGENPEDVYVSMDAINQAMEVSPTLADLRSLIDYKMDQVDVEIDEAGNPTREFYAWYLRWAALDAGVYDGGAKEANAFFEQIDSELKMAFENGTLSRRNITYVSSMSPPITAENMWSIIKHSLKHGMWKIAFDKNFADVPMYYESSGTDNNMDLFLQVIDQTEVSKEQVQVTHPYSEERLIYMKFITKLYDVLGVPISILSILIFVYGLIDGVKTLTKEKPEPILMWVLELGVLLTMWANQLIVSMNFYSVGAEKNPMNYSCTAYILWHMFVAIQMCVIIIKFESMKKRSQQ